MANRLGIRGYARHRGVSHVAVIKALQSGRLDGAFTVDRKGRKWIHVARADAAWDANTDPAQVREPEARRGGAPPRQGSLPGLEPEGAGPAAMAAGEAAANGRLTHARASTVKTIWDGKLRALEYRLRVGELVEIAQVRSEAFKLARTLRDRLLAVSGRVDALLAAEADPARVREILDEEIRTALRSLEGEEG